MNVGNWKRMGKCLWCLLLAVLLLALTACSLVEKRPDDTMAPQEEEEPEVVETLPPVQVTMPEYELTYSGELEDLIVVEELPETEAGDLEFRVKLTGGEYTVFVLKFNTDQGELVTVLTDAKGEKIPVAFEMAELPDGLDDAEADLFYSAQDAVNEIIGSLKLK